MLAINKTTAAKLIFLWNLPTLILLFGACEIGNAVFAWLTNDIFYMRNGMTFCRTYGSSNAVYLGAKYQEN